MRMMNWILPGLTICCAFGCGDQSAPIAVEVQKPSVSPPAMPPVLPPVMEEPQKPSASPAGVNGVWRCNARGKNQFTEVILFSDSLFIVHELDSAKALDVLIAGSYKLDGNKFLRTEKLNRFLKGADVQKGWLPAPKSDKVIESRYVTREYEVSDPAASPLFLQPVRWVNWDGRDSLDVRNKKVEACMPMHQLHPEFKSVKDEIPSSLLSEVLNVAAQPK